MVLKYKQQAGFTIVELLIVIVVIGILASITIVSYNGIQTRAKNQQTVSAVTAYYKAIMQYATVNGANPTTYGCLGVQSEYNSNPCYVGSSSYNYSAPLRTALFEYINQPPSLPMDTASNETVTARGIFYHTAASHGGQYIGFIALNATSCPPIAGATPTTSTAMSPHMYCRILLPPAS